MKARALLVGAALVVVGASFDSAASAAAASAAATSAGAASAAATSAGVASAGVESANIFDSREILAVTLVGPLNDLLRDRDPDPTQFDMELVVGDQSLDVKVRQRGNYRRQRDICKFPPLRLNFGKKSVKGTVFEGQDKLKLVTHCGDRDSFEQNVFKEYLAYRILSLFTEESFRVRLLEITYEDTAGKRSTKRHGFVIEDVDAMAKRLGAKHVKPPEVEGDQLAQPAATVVAVYQYFIGNTDYSLIRAKDGDTCCHNVKLIQYAADVFTAVPYDYDMAGIVSAAYAFPDGRLGLQSVRDRLYRGFCTDRETLDAVLGAYQDKRATIYELINETGLMGKSSGRTTKFFDSFYRMVDKESRVERVFVKGCR